MDSLCSTNKAFKSIPQTAKDKILSDKSFIKLDYGSSTHWSKDEFRFGEDATTVVTI